VPPQVGVPLKNQELEDIIIYLGSLGKQNTITTEALASTYKQWSLAQQKSTIPSAKECACPTPNPALGTSLAFSSTTSSSGSSFSDLL
jgi:hypothetical protein